MKVQWSAYIVFADSGIRRMTKSKPDLRSGEFAVRLQLQVPKSVFARPFPEVSIAIPEAAVVHPDVKVMPAEDTPTQ